MSALCSRPIIHACCVLTGVFDRVLFVRHPIQLYQSFALHLQFHLGIFRVGMIGDFMRLISRLVLGAHAIKVVRSEKEHLAAEDNPVSRNSGGCGGEETTKRHSFVLRPSLWFNGQA